MSNINEKNQGPRWYVAHTYTGYENKVKDSIEKIVENRGLGHLIYDTKVPSVKENVLDENGKPVLDKNGEWIFGYIDNDLIKDPAGVSVRNTLIILLVSACLFGTAIYFIKRKRQN